MDAPDATAAAPDADSARGADIGAMARALLADIEAGGQPSLTLLLRAQRLARSADAGRLHHWLDCELRGYDADAPDADELMRLSRRWKDESGRIGYLEPLPALEARIAVLEERARQTALDTPPLPEDADAQMVALHTALAERAAERAEREQRNTLAQLGDLTAIRSAVLALVHAFADRMAATHPVPETPPPPSIVEEPREAAWGEGNNPAGADAAADAESDLLPEAMLTDDAALDGLVSVLEDNALELEDVVVEDWDAGIAEDGSNLETMSADELADMLDAALSSPDAVVTEFEPAPPPEIGLPAGAEAEVMAPEPALETASEPEIPAEPEPEPVIESEPRDDSGDDPYAPLMSEIMRLREQMEDADAQEAVAAAVACGASLARFAELFTKTSVRADDAQAALLDAIGARAGDGETAADLRERVDGVFDRLIEVEIGGDALIMKRVCGDASRLMSDLLNL